MAYNLRIVINYSHFFFDVVTKNAVADDSEWLHSKKPLRPGQIWTIYSERRGVDLDAEGVDRDRLYYLDCYTLINVNGIKGSWKDKRQTTPFHH